jgi:hypothetical protein
VLPLCAANVFLPNVPKDDSVFITVRGAKDTPSLLAVQLARQQHYGVFHRINNIDGLRLIGTTAGK